MRDFGKYLIDHLVLDFDGDINMEEMNALLLEDGSPLAHDLRARMIAEGGPDDFLVVLADCLKEYLPQGLSEDVVADQVAFYVKA